jgi:multidrug resistance efflux pump
VLRAIDEIEFVLEVTESPATPMNPVHNLARLGSAVSALDTAMATARNQQQRLDHARTALVGALVGARSEIGVAKSSMAGNRADVDARTRLAEAERQLLLAESENDPVGALDAARRAATAARDADALARYRS